MAGNQFQEVHKGSSPNITGVKGLGFGVKGVGLSTRSLPLAVSIIVAT